MKMAESKLIEELNNDTFEILEKSVGNKTNLRDLSTLLAKHGETLLLLIYDSLQSRKDVSNIDPETLINDLTHLPVSMVNKLICNGLIPYYKIYNVCPPWIVGSVQKIPFRHINSDKCSLYMVLKDPYDGKVKIFSYKRCVLKKEDFTIENGFQGNGIYYSNGNNELVLKLFVLFQKNGYLNFSTIKNEDFIYDAEGTLKLSPFGLTSTKRRKSVSAKKEKVVKKKLKQDDEESEDFSNIEMSIPVGDFFKYTE